MHKNLWPVVVQDPKTMETIFNHIASGGTLAGLCEVWGVNYGIVRGWINSSEDRAKVYIEACAARDDLTKDIIFQQLMSVAKSKLRTLFNEDGSLKSPHDWPEDADAFVASIETEELFDGAGDERQHIGYTKKIKLWDKLKSIEMLGKKLGLFAEKVEHSGKITLEDIIARSHEAPKKN